MSSQAEIPRQSVDVDIVCVGFGPAMGGFLTTLCKGLVASDGSPRFESRVSPGMPLQVLCYERADDIAFGVSGAVTRARSIRSSFPDLDPAQIPMAAPVRVEKLVYLLDSVGASRRPRWLRVADRMVRSFPSLTGCRNDAIEIPYTPDFLHKKDGIVISIGQFMQWVGQQIIATGQVQIWPGTPVSEPLIENKRIVGVRLADQGVDRNGRPDAGYLPGMDVRASLTVVGDGPVGPVGRKLNEHFGLPPGHHQREWAVGAKMVVELPEGCALEPGTVLHTLGFPEPEIFGFFYVHPGNIASVGIFVPSWFASPVRTTYRYLQYYLKHPYLWRHLKGARLRSWGAKSLLESGRAGEPYLVLDGCARIGEGSGSTNVLTGSGVDEAWATGVQLAEGVLELLENGADFSRANLERTYLSRRRASWVEKEARVAARARVGFHQGFLRGLAGMALTGLTRGLLTAPGEVRSPQAHTVSLEKYYKNKISKQELNQIREQARAAGAPLHEALMRKAGWPEVELDGKLLISHQDALLVGGKVQASPGFADHVVFLYPELCDTCETKICVEICSGEAITAGADGRPQFDRDKCVHCGACVWNCTQTLPEAPERTNIELRAGAGGLHSTEN